MTPTEKELCWFLVSAAVLFVIAGMCSGCKRNINIKMTFPDQIAQLDDDDCGDDPLCPLEYAQQPGRQRGPGSQQRPSRRRDRERAHRVTSPP